MRLYLVRARHRGVGVLFVVVVVGGLVVAVVGEDGEAVLGGDASREKGLGVGDGIGGGLVVAVVGRGTIMTTPRGGGFGFGCPPAGGLGFGF
jgi:hypothetical protein